MPINKETIISVFDDKLTLMQWLKTINKALEDAVLTGVEITKKGNATLSFKFTFEDGTYLETNDLVLQQGESVANAFIQNGHLYLTLTNGTNLDAGNVKPVSNFSIDASQHLIVNYGDGTSQDLGAIFSGNVNISGNLSVSGTISQALDAIIDLDLTTSMSGVNITNIYSKLRVKNNILYIIVNFKLENTTEAEVVSQAIAGKTLTISSAIASQIYDLNGNAGNISTSACGVCAVSGLESTNLELSGITTQDINLTFLKQNAANTYSVMIRNNDGYRIPANATRYITARMVLTI